MMVMLNQPLNLQNKSTILETSDGYKWKYMYTLSASQQANFLSTDFMAVETNSTVSSLVDGAIDIIKLKWFRWCKWHTYRHCN